MNDKPEAMQGYYGIRQHQLPCLGFLTWEPISSGSHLSFSFLPVYIPILPALHLHPEEAQAALRVGAESRDCDMCNHSL